MAGVMQTTWFSELDLTVQKLLTTSPKMTEAKSLSEKGKPLPVMVTSVPPNLEPEVGAIEVITISYLKSTAVAGLTEAIADPPLITSTL